MFSPDSGTSIVRLIRLQSLAAALAEVWTHRREQAPHTAMWGWSFCGHSVRSHSRNSPAKLTHVGLINNLIGSKKIIRNLCLVYQCRLQIYSFRVCVCVLWARKFLLELLFLSMHETSCVLKIVEIWRSKMDLSEPCTPQELSQH